MNFIRALQKVYCFPARPRNRPCRSCSMGKGLVFLSDSISFMTGLYRRWFSIVRRGEYIGVS